MKRKKESKFIRSCITIYEALKDMTPLMILTMFLITREATIFIAVFGSLLISASLIGVFFKDKYKNET